MTKSAAKKKPAKREASMFSSPLGFVGLSLVHRPCGTLAHGGPSIDVTDTGKAGAATAAAAATKKPKTAAKTTAKSAAVSEFGCSHTLFFIFYFYMAVP